MMRRRGRPGLLGTVARTAVVAGTATAVVGGVRNRQEQKYAAQQDQAAQQAPPPEPVAAPVAASGGGVDIIGELTKLAEMHTNSILTDDEFAAAKAKLLG